jgi:hypothetical protein
VPGQRSSCGPWTYATAGASDTKTITGLNNGSTSTVQLRSCKRRHRQPLQWLGLGLDHRLRPDRRHQHQRVRHRQPDQLVGQRRPQRQGCELGRTPRGTTVANGTTGSGAFSTSGGETLAYDTPYTYTLTVTDTALAPGQTSARANKSDSVSVRTDPNNPTVSASKGTPCDGSNCPGATIACVGTCWYINSTAADFNGTASCGVYNVDGSGQIAGSWSQGNGLKRTSIWVGRNTPFYIACNNGARSSNTTW